MGNMNLVTGYRGTNHITADDHGSLNAAIFGLENSGCVLNRGKKFKASVVSNNRITIADGDLIFQGRHGRIAPGNTVSLTIENLKNDEVVKKVSNKLIQIDGKWYFPIEK